MSDPNKKLLVYDRPTGDISILQHIRGQRIIDDYEAIGRSARYFDVPNDDIGSMFIDGEQLRNKHRMFARLDRDEIKADGMDTAKIFGVPAGTQVTMSDGLSSFGGVADGLALHITAPMPAKWTVRLNHPAHLPEEFTIIAR